MFSSLHKIDIVATSPAGAMTLVQTDHRTPAEVGEDQGLSMIFALTRMLVPRTGEYAEATVQYACVGAVHPLLETAAAACGAELEGERVRRDLTAVAKQAPEDLADAAFTTVGRRVLMMSVQGNYRDSSPCGAAGVPSKRSVPFSST